MVTRRKFKSLIIDGGKVHTTSMKYYLSQLNFHTKTNSVNIPSQCYATHRRRHACPNRLALGWTVSQRLGAPEKSCWSGWPRRSWQLLPCRRGNLDLPVKSGVEESRGMNCYYSHWNNKQNVESWGDDHLYDTHKDMKSSKEKQATADRQIPSQSSKKHQKVNNIPGSWSAHKPAVDRWSLICPGSWPPPLRSRHRWLPGGPVRGTHCESLCTPDLLVQQ